MQSMTENRALVFKERGATIEVEREQIGTRVWGVTTDLSGKRPARKATAHVAKRFVMNGRPSYGVVLVGPQGALIGWIVAPEAVYTSGSAVVLASREQAVAEYRKHDPSVAS